MADRMAAEIWIGGSIPESLVEEFCGTIRDEGLGLNYGEESFKPQDAEELLEGTLKDSGVLRLCCEEVAWGEFQDLEFWLQSNDIPYTRKSDGKYEHNPMVVEFRPEEGLHEMVANKSLEPVATASSLEPVRDKLETAMDLLRRAAKAHEEGQDMPHDLLTSGNRLVRDTVDRLGRKAIEQAMGQLTKAMPPKLPPLSPLRILVDASGARANNQQPRSAIMADNPRLMAVFRPQAWVNDQAIDVNQPVEFDATEDILRLSAAAIRAFEYNSYESDYLVEDQPASQDHSGPFEVDVDLDAWLKEHRVMDRKALSRAQWWEIRQRYRPQTTSGEGR